MEQRAISDSNYGSARTAEQSSMSSFSLGSSGVATGISGMHSKGSTSGCSSGLSYNTQNRKVKKKEAIKRCLQELKSLMPQQGKAKAGTVSTLKTVLQHMKKIKEEETGGAGADIELLGAMPEGEWSNMAFPFAPDLDEKQELLKIVMSVKECLVLQVSPEILEMLGYPKNYWFNQCLLDYVYKRDVVTISSNLSVMRGQTKTQQASTSTATAEESSGEETEKRKTMFFFRLRHYKSLRQGFSLNRSDKYSVFCGRTKVQKVPLSFPPGTPAEGLQSDSMYLVLECQPLHSAYASPHCVPERRSFATRHTIYCNYNFIHPTALPLLGYLPQCMIGSSVFDYYHPQDLQMLLGIYQQVVQMPGQTFKSLPYRMRAKNGDYITVETEWSSFVNPWTKRFDFIMGQHEVVKGPGNPDVFMDTFLSRKPIELTYEHRQIHKKIKSLLLQNVAPPKRSSASASSSSMEQTQSSSGIGMHVPSASTAMYRMDIGNSDLIEKTPKRKPEETLTKDETSKEDDERASPTQSVGTNSSLLTLSEEEKALIYERLNYAQNILRFLNSCQGEGLEDVGGHKQASPYAKEGSESSDDEGLTVEVDIPKPPSCASSTKALVSDQEAREEVMPPSPAQEDVQEYSSQPTADDLYEPISLTEDVLKMHNLLQEQYYLQKMTKEKEGFKSILQEGKSRKKRLLNDDTSHKKAAKFLRQEDGQPSARHPKVVTNTNLSPPFPMTKLDRPSATPSASNMFNQSGPRGMLQNAVTQSSMSMPSHFMSYTPLIQMPMSVGNNPGSTPMAQSGLQWPFYHPQAVSIMQPFFYQPLMPQQLNGQTVVNQGFLPPGNVPINRVAATTTSISSQSQSKTQNSSSAHNQSQKESLKTGETSKEQEVSDTLSFGDTGSSILYLLESNSGSQNNSSTSDVDQSEEEKIKKKQLLPAAPPWATAVNWCDDVVMRYRMPSMALGKTLKEDRAVLKKHKQQTPVMMQMQELMAQLDEISEEDDVDLLFITEEGVPVEAPAPMEDEEQVEENATPPAEEEDRETPTSIMMETQESGEDVEDKNTQIDEERQEKMEMSPVSDEGCPKGCGSPDKMSHDSDSGSSDSGSKGSSMLTPSDQRSHEEVVSSVKESDNASSESGSSKENKNADTASESEQQQQGSQKMTRSMFMKLFVPMKIDFVPLPMHDPVWVQEANFSAAVQMTYTKDNPDLGCTLKEDKQTLDYCPQPELVQEQLNELVMSLNSSSENEKNDDSSGCEGTKDKSSEFVINETNKGNEQLKGDSNGAQSERQGPESLTNESNKDTEVKSDRERENVTMQVVEVAKKEERLISPVQMMDLEAKPQQSSSDDDNFRHPSTYRRMRKSRTPSARTAHVPMSSSSSDGCSPNPSIKLEKPDSNYSSDQQTSGDSDTWEKLRRAVKSSMTSMFEGKNVVDMQGTLHHQKDSRGQSLVPSSERSSELSAYASQPSTVEDLMDQLFKSDEAIDTMEMD